MLSHFEQVKMGKSVPNIKVQKKTTRKIRKRKKRKWKRKTRSLTRGKDKLASGLDKKRMINQNRKTREIKVKEKENQTLTGTLAMALTGILDMTLTGTLAKTITRILAMTLTRIKVS